MLGLALVISHSIVLFNIIKYCGAAYLIYIGIKSLRSKTEALPIAQPLPTQAFHPARAFFEGFLTNLLNPKCTLTMLSIFTIVVNPETDKLTQFIYGIEIALIALTWFTVLAYSITIDKVKAKITGMQAVIMKMTGILLISLGIKIALDES